MSEKSVIAAEYLADVQMVRNEPWQKTLNHCKGAGKEGETLVRKIITNKHYRPIDVEDQYHLLSHISELDSLSNSLKCFSSVASSHKAMESMNYQLVLQAIEKIESLLFESDAFDEIPLEDDIRTDRIHVIFSTYSVLFHMYIFIEDFNKIECLSQHAMEYYRSINHTDYRTGFYQTCGNVYRLFAISLIIDLIKSKEFDDELRLGEIREVLMKGISFADPNPIKFDEFTVYANSFYLLKKLIDKKEKRKIQDFNNVFFTLTRNHGLEKTKLLRANFTKFLTDNLKREDVDEK